MFGPGLQADTPHLVLLAGPFELLDKKPSAPKEGELSESAIVSFLATREGAALVRGFLAIKEKAIRQNVIDFIGTLKAY